jgi:hypothetical protein
MTTSITSAKADLVMNSEVISFGWFKKLDEVQMNSHVSAIGQALLYADNGESVHWDKNGAWGMSKILHTDSNSQGYCRTMYIEIFAFNKKKTDVHKYCYDSPSESWHQRAVRR